MIIYERQEEEEEETKGVIEELGVVAHGKSLMVTQVHAMQLHLHPFFSWSSAFLTSQGTHLCLLSLFWIMKSGAPTVIYHIITLS